MNLGYLVPRVIRHFLPERIVRFMLLRSMVIKPGLETVDPQGAVIRYVEVLRRLGTSLQGKRVLVFGYGGRFDIGVGLLRAGAAHAALCDRFARPDDRHNLRLQKSFPDAIRNTARGPRPDHDHMQLIEADVRTLSIPEPERRYDLVISNSVYEHVDDASGITAALARLTMPDGVHIHFIDLRDHFFKYPFEMLKYSASAWRSFLNPSSNHNRLRLWDYRRTFEANFAEVDLDVLARDDAAFERARPGLRPEFVSGKPAEDAATLIRIVASRPRN